MTAEDFATAIQPFVPIMTILATGLVSLLVAWLTALMARKSERAKIAADDKREKERLAHEAAMAAADRDRAREIADEQRAASDAEAQQIAAAEEARRAKDVAELWFGTIAYVDAHDPSAGDDRRFDHYLAERWPSLEIDLRRAIGSLTDGESRNRLLAVISAFDDSEAISYHGSNPKSWASWLANMAADLSMTAARSDQPDAELLERYSSFFDSLTAVNDYRQDLWETQRAERRR